MGRSLSNLVMKMERLVINSNKSNGSMMNIAGISIKKGMFLL
jgi:hypothetical protein